MFFIFYKYLFKIQNSLNKKVNDDIFSSIFKSLSVSFGGYIFCYLIGLYTLYNHTDYVRLRRSYERDIEFNRDNVKEIYLDYPFAGKVDYLYNDFEVRNNINKKKFKN